MKPIIIPIRLLFDCPEIDSSDHSTYSECSSGLGEYMYAYATDTTKVYVFLFVCRNKGIDYVSVFIWDFNCDDPVKRFIIRQGYRMNESEEEDYLKYTNAELECDEEAYKEFLKKIQYIFPSWGVINYTKEQIGILLSHIYYASHRSGPKSIFYRNNLPTIAENINHLPLISLFSETPETIIGRNLSIDNLRVLNKDFMIQYLFSDESISMFKNIYELFPEYVNVNILRCQWLYLRNISDDGQNIIESFNEDLYSCLEDESLYTLYKEFYNVRSQIKTKKLIPTPMPVHINEVVKQIKAIHNYQENIKTADDLIKKHSVDQNWAFSDSIYIVLNATHVQEVIDESVTLQLSLINFIDRFVNGNVMILLLRRVSCINEPYVSIIVTRDVCRGYSIEYVIGRCLPPVSVYRFVEQYARAMGIKYNPEYVLSFDDVGFTEEHKTYVEEYKANHWKNEE